MTPRAAPLWSHDVGYPPHRVTVYEHAGRNRYLYLRWRDGEGKARNWVKESLRRPLRDEKGRILEDVQRWAIHEAESRMRLLRDGTPTAAALVAPAVPLSIVEGLQRILDPQVGRFPIKSPHRKEVEVALKFAARIWGSARAWNTIRRADLTALWRARIKELRANGNTGHRGAEITVARVLTVAAWLKDHELIEQAACVAPKHWKVELRNDWRLFAGETSDPTPERPRHTIEEFRQLLERSWDVDPRMGLLLALGAELRLGQVLRCWRRHLLFTLEDGASGWLEVPSSGKKRGARVRLTAGQCASVRRALGPGGYLSRLEAAGGDYPLFPAGQLPGGRGGVPMADPARHATAAPIERRTIGAWFAETEQLCGIPSIPGRGPYGLRRVGVDGAKQLHISREGLRAWGGWTDTQVPDAIYAEQEQVAAAEEAATMRAQLRGEATND